MDYGLEELKEARRQIDSTMHKLTESLLTLESKADHSRYLSQITLAKRRLDAFRIAAELLEKELIDNSKVKGGTVMDFCWVTLPVSNLEKSLHFYHDILGLPISSQQENPRVSLVMLGEEGKPKIELIQDFGKQKEKHHADITVGIGVPSLEKALDYVRKNQITVSRGPLSPNPHISFAYILDPDGYEVQLVESK